MLRADQVDVESLILARNDTGTDGDWWFDPTTGTSLYLGLDDDEDLPALAVGEHIVIPRQTQPRDDAETFFDHAADRGVDDDELAHLWQALTGRGGMRRFREAVATSSAAQLWTDWTIAREGVRALRWLVERGVVDADSVDAWAAERGVGAV